MMQMQKKLQTSTTKSKQEKNPTKPPNSTHLHKILTFQHWPYRHVRIDAVVQLFFMALGNNVGKNSAR